MKTEPTWTAEVTMDFPTARRDSRSVGTPGRPASSTLSMQLRADFSWTDETVGDAAFREGLHSPTLCLSSKIMRGGSPVGIRLPFADPRSLQDQWYHGTTP